MQSPDTGDEAVRNPLGVGDVPIEVLTEERILKENPPDDERGELSPLVEHQDEQARCR